MKTNKYYILAFDSTHYAIRVEELLKRSGLEGEMISTPRDIDSSCGLSIRFPEHILERVKELVNVKENRIRLYISIIVNGNKVYMEQEM